jgi:hypothetical protein
MMNQPEQESEPVRLIQPVQEYAISFEDRSSPFSHVTHLGTDYGAMGPGASHLSWKREGESGHVSVDLASAGAAGMWHSLEGLKEEADRYLDFTKCYPYVRDEFQPRCVGMTIQVRGTGSLKLELQSPEGRILWWATEDISAGDSEGPRGS